MSSRQYLEDMLRTHNHVRIKTNSGEREAQVSKDAFEKGPDYVKDIIDLIYDDCTGKTQFGNPYSYIESIEPVTE